MTFFCTECCKTLYTNVSDKFLAQFDPGEALYCDECSNDRPNQPSHEKS